MSCHTCDLLQGEESAGGSISAVLWNKDTAAHVRKQRKLSYLWFRGSVWANTDWQKDRYTWEKVWTDLDLRNRNVYTHNRRHTMILLFHVWLVKACMDQLSYSYPLYRPSSKPPPSAALTPSCCRQTINQHFVSWMAHIHCSRCAQQKGKINKEQASPLNWPSHGSADGWTGCDMTEVTFKTLSISAFFFFSRTPPLLPALDMH